MSAIRSIEAGGTIAYKVAYARLPGCTPTVAIFLSQVAYWSARSATGWCWITHDKMEEQTALSRDQQDRSAKILCDLGVLRKELKGLPAKIHYNVDFDFLSILLVGNPQPVLLETLNHTIEKITEENTTIRIYAPLRAQEPQSAGIATAVTAQAQTSPESQAREEQIAPRRARSSPPPSSAAPPPSQEELSAYMKETWPWIPALEYEKCHAHHQARGWVDGKNKPWKDWRAVAKTWITNWKQFNADKWLEIQRFEQTKARQAAASQQRSLPDDF
jgi:hypothetical protein